MAWQATCSSCQRPIDWSVSEAGRRMPVDADSAGVAGGNLAVRRDDDGTLHSRVLTADRPLQDGEKLGTAHWATCPRAKAHRIPRPR